MLLCYSWVLCGNQVGLILMDMMTLGADPDKIHIIGFSLGAHVAGCAGQLLKSRGRMIGRITGNAFIYLWYYQSKRYCPVLVVQQGLCVSP